MHGSLARRGQQQHGRGITLLSRVDNPAITPASLAANKQARRVPGQLTGPSCVEINIHCRPQGFGWSPGVARGQTRAQPGSRASAGFPARNSTPLIAPTASHIFTLRGYPATWRGHTNVSGSGIRIDPKSHPSLSQEKSQNVSLSNNKE